MQRTQDDPLARLAELPGVADGMDAARRAIDAVLWDRQVRSTATAVTARSSLAGAQASAALEGADLAIAEDSPMGRTLLAAQAVTEQAEREARAWEQAPLQAIATLHAVVVRSLAEHAEQTEASHPGHLSLGQPGRPRDSSVPASTGIDPYAIGSLPPAQTVAPRLQALAQVLTSPTRAPGLLVAAVVHGELMALRPFQRGNGLVARAAVRCVLITRGVDPAMFTIPEEGMLRIGRPAYVRAVQDFAAGTPDRMASALIAFATACTHGAACVSAP